MGISSVGGTPTILRTPRVVSSTRTNLSMNNLGWSTTTNNDPSMCYSLDGSNSNAPTLYIKPYHAGATGLWKYNIATKTATYFGSFGTTGAALSMFGFPSTNAVYTQSTISASGGSTGTLYRLNTNDNTIQAITGMANMSVSVPLPLNTRFNDLQGYTGNQREGLACPQNTNIPSWAAYVRGYGTMPAPTTTYTYAGTNAYHWACPIRSGDDDDTNWSQVFWSIGGGHPTQGGFGSPHILSVGFGESAGSITSYWMAQPHHPRSNTLGSYTDAGNYQWWSASSSYGQGTCIENRWLALIKQNFGSIALYDLEQGLFVPLRGNTNIDTYNNGSYRSFSNPIYISATKKLYLFSSHANSANGVMHELELAFD